MSRRAKKYRKDIVPDVVYGDSTVSMLINKVMLDGRKTVASKIMYSAMDQLKVKVEGESPLDVVKKAIENIKPLVEVRSRRVGGATYQVPVDVRPARRLTLALRWLTAFSRSRNEKTMPNRLAAEILDAYNERGASFKKKEDVHRMAEANRAFAHFNW
ncbi:MAG: 30S ribosomal protein S7 [Bdellovibrionaceae bacterium]|nr:30S ribosomal protein S7 [Pseudobdellovibrionaceae bacterium]